MLKLLRYDAKYLARTFLPLCGLCTVCCLLLTLIDNKEQRYLWILPAKNVFLLVMLAASLLLPLTLFFKRALGAQAYFFLSAPIPPRRHIQCRLLSGLICTSLTCALTAALDGFSKAYYGKEYQLLFADMTFDSLLYRLTIIFFLQSFIIFLSVTAFSLRRKRLAVTTLLTALFITLIICAYIEYMKFSRLFVSDINLTYYVRAVFSAALGAAFYLPSVIIFHKRFELGDV